MFDPLDVGFNALAGPMAIAASLALARARRWGGVGGQTGPSRDFGA